MSTGEKVSEDIADAIASLECAAGHVRDGYDKGLAELSGKQAIALLAELQRLRSSSDDAKGRWVPWKPGDALPATAPVLHWTTWFDKEYTDAPMMRANHAHDFERWGVTAYWSIHLPPPYSAMSQETP